jgi:DNA polymerase-3 subunit delta
VCRAKGAAERPKGISRSGYTTSQTTFGKNNQNKEVIGNFPSFVFSQHMAGCRLVGMANKKDSSIIIITGDDEYLVNRTTSEIIAKQQKQDASIELETIDGMVTTVGDAETAIQRCKSALLSPGLFSSSRIVWFKDVSFLADTRPARSETVQNALVDLVDFIAKGIPDGFALIITAESIDKRRSFAKKLAKCATIKTFDRGGKDTGQRTEIVRAILDQYNCEMPPNLINMLCEKVGSDTRRLVMETEKLCLYVLPDKRIDETAIQSIVTTTTETAFYELANRFCEFDLTGTVNTLHELLFQKHSVMGLIAHLENTIRDLLIFREALDQGWLQRNGHRFSWTTVPPEADEALSSLERDPRKLPPFIANRLIEGASRFSRKRLDHCLHHIVLAHEKMVSSRVPPELVMEILLVRMLGRVKRTKAHS